MARTLSVAVERFPIAGTFTIARGSKTEAVVVTATVSDGTATGRGECVPYSRYGETVDGVVRAVEAQRTLIETGAGRADLAAALPAGAARNALDCALWDLEAKIAGIPVHVLAGIDRLKPVTSAYTLSLGSPAAMAAAAQAASARPILKIKLGGSDSPFAGDAERLQAVREHAPDAVLIVDANEGWTPADLGRRLDLCASLGVALVEQPLPAAADEALKDRPRTVPVCADESVHDRAGLDRLARLYDVVNIKLDKTGGLTEAIALADAAEARGLGLMIGCMVGTSLAMAPALLLAPRARFVDLDGPLLLAQDRPDGLTYDGSVVSPPSPALWG